MNGFALVNAARIRANSLAAGAQPLVDAAHQDEKPVVTAIREIDSGRVKVSPGRRTRRDVMLDTGSEHS